LIDLTEIDDLKNELVAIDFYDLLLNECYISCVFYLQFIVHHFANNDWHLLLVNRDVVIKQVPAVICSFSSLDFPKGGAAQL